jgi:hypothetical protein
LWCDPAGLLQGHPVWFTIVAITLLAASSVHGQKPTESQVEATYLYNFGQFVVWPSKAGTAATSFDICILGVDPFGPSLNRILAGETIAGQSVVAKRISAAQDSASCRVLFISSSESGRLKGILVALGDASVLTVSDLPEFTRSGGMVQFLLVGNRIRFEVNLAATERAGLTLSSELLKVAVNVRTTTPLGE